MLKTHRRYVRRLISRFTRLIYQAHMEVHSRISPTDKTVIATLQPIAPANWVSLSPV